jgi:hypothetical protein
LFSRDVHVDSRPIVDVVEWRSLRSWRLAAALAALPLLGPAPPPSPRQTASGALERASRRLEPLRREAPLEHQTSGTRGRINGLIDNNRLTQEPALVQPPLSGPWSF